MHDLLEGIIPFIIVKVLKLIVKSRGGPSLAHVNHIIQNFNYGNGEIKNKPALIKKNDKLRQSSSQIWLLMHCLPIMFVDLVPNIEVTTTWKAFKNISMISRIVFSNNITTKDLYDLREIVVLFFKRMRKLNVKITPKMHHLVHYPRYIQLFGPLKHFYCMRFEHAFSKLLQGLLETVFSFL